VPVAEWHEVMKKRRGGVQVLSVTFDRPRCIATLSLQWAGAHSPRDFQIGGALDGDAAGPTLVDGTATPPGYGDRLDSYDLGDYGGTCNAGGFTTRQACEGAGYTYSPSASVRLRRVTLTTSSGHGSHYELSNLAWTERQPDNCPSCAGAPPSCAKLALPE
jgi:hypothetical protein